MAYDPISAFRTKAMEFQHLMGQYQQNYKDTVKRVDPALHNRIIDLANTINSAITSIENFLQETGLGQVWAPIIIAGIRYFAIGTAVTAFLSLVAKFITDFYKARDIAETQSQTEIVKSLPVDQRTQIAQQTASKQVNKNSSWDFGLSNIKKYLPPILLLFAASMFIRR